MIKTCNVCGVEFFKEKHGRVCIPCQNTKRRTLWNKNDHLRNRYKRYERTFGGMVMRKYRNMSSRIKGIQKKKFHLYGGKDLMSREEFYLIAKSSKDLKTLWRKWVDSGYQRRLAPSVDRIDVTKGYTKDNIQFITHSENSSKGSIGRHKDTNGSK